MATQPPNIRMVNGGTRYVNGLELTNGATNLLFTVAPGFCRDTTSTNDIYLPATGAAVGTTSVSIAFAGLNGLDTGVAAASTFYAVYVISSSTRSNFTPSNPQQSSFAVPANSFLPFNYLPPGILVSTSFVAPLLPAGYDMYRRIGAVLTDGAIHLLPFSQIAINDANRLMWYDTPILVLNAGASAAWAAVSLVTAVPPIGQTSGKFVAGYTPTAGGDLAQLLRTGSASSVGNAEFTGATTAVLQTEMIDCPCSVLESIDYQNVGTLSLSVAAYVDLL